ncbi:MAG: APC family permease [Ignavibacteriales bacterium]|nr:APC family permease [Ignavibacteriales bacterium]
MAKDISLYMPFVGNIFPFNDIGPKFVAILSIIFLTIVNYIGVMFGGVVQTVVTYIKIISIVALALLLLIFGSGNLANLVTDSQLSNNGQNIFIMIELALSGAFWAYDGWNNVTFISGEIKKSSDQCTQSAANRNLDCDVHLRSNQCSLPVHSSDR